jgi:hypothetical protein
MDDIIAAIKKGLFDFCVGSVKYFLLLASAFDAGIRSTLSIFFLHRPSQVQRMHAGGYWRSRLSNKGSLSLA